MTNKEILALEDFAKRLDDMRDSEFTCTDLKNHILDIIAYIQTNKIGQDVHDTLDNQLKDAIASIRNVKYGTINQKSKTLFNNVKKDALWFLNGKIVQFKRTIDERKS